MVESKPRGSAIPVGIGACLLGQPVRCNGLGKKSNDVLTALTEFFEWRPFCPEVAIGPGAPRVPICLVGERALDSGAHDITEALRAGAAAWLAHQDDLCGHVLVQGSPSCGMARVNRYPAAPVRGALCNGDGSGIFASALMAAAPLLPVEEDGRLRDAHLRESFVVRVFTYHDWRQLCRAGLSRHALLQFYARYKYLVMSRHVPTYHRLGRLLADAGASPLPELAGQVIASIMDALRRPASRAGHTNALLHIRGYLKHRISAAEKAELGELIEQYRRGSVPLIAPLTLLRRHFRRNPDAYIEQQVFLRPYPDALGLGNDI